MRRSLALLAVLAAGIAAAAPSATAHTSGCHSSYSCPSDHHSYVWYDAGGQGWDCVKPGAPEYTSADTTAITYDGYTYYCHAAGASSPPPTTTPTPAPAPTPPADGDGDGVPDASDACPTQAAATTDGCPAPAAAPQAAADAARCHVRGPLPDKTCTPGGTLHVSTRQVCKRGYSRRVRNVPESVKDRVYANYGVTRHSAATYEVDHLIPLELGGSNSIKNLFPEAASPRPGFHEKDKLESRLHTKVCNRQMSLKVAQRAIRTNWVKAYNREFR
jgi:hypothetical protein